MNNCLYSPHSRNQSAFSIIELLLALVVIGVLLVISVRYYQSVKYQQQQTTVATTVKDIISASTSWGTSYPDYSGISLQALINVNLLPTAYKKNPWGGTYEISQADGNPLRIKITVKGIPADRKTLICTSLTNQFSDYKIVCP